MTNSFDRRFRSSLLAGVALGCLVALAPQTAKASSHASSNADRQGSDALQHEKHMEFHRREIHNAALIDRFFPCRVCFVNKWSMYRGHGTGVAAGEGMLANVTVFTSLGYSFVDDDFSGARYDSDTISVSYGGDYTVSDKLILGLSGGYSNTDTDTKFNSGGSDTDSWTLSPYVAYRINDMFSIDVSGGYSESESENHRVAGGVRITGDQDSDIHFFAVNGRVAKWFGNIGVNGNIGYIYSKSETDNMTESNANFVAGAKDTFEQLEIGAQVSYYTERYMPYFSVAYRNELGRENIAALPTDDDEFALTQGVSLMSSGAWSGGLLVSEIVGRAHFNSVTVSGSLNYAF